MGTIVDTPTGTFKNRFIDNVNQLEDAIAHFMPELPSNVFAPVLAMAIVFAIDWRMGWRVSPPSHSASCSTWA